MKDQCEALLHALQQQPLTSLEIHQRLGIYRAGARVFDLRERGHRIATDLVPVTNRYGRPCRVARYALLPDTDNRDLWESAKEPGHEHH